MQKAVVQSQNFYKSDFLTGFGVLSFVTRTIVMLIFSTIILSVPFLFRWVGGGFRLGKTACDLPLNPEWSVGEISLELEAQIQAIFARPFSYLSHGGQSFVFESENKEFILKLFRASTKPHPWRNRLRRLIYDGKKRLDPEEKIKRLFSACKLAYEQASDLTGLVYIHLNSTDKMLPVIVLRDSLRRVHTIDLNRCYFALQRKGKPIRDVFSETVKNNDKKRFLQLTQSFVSLLKERTQRKLCNSDTKVGPNFGFLDDCAIEWDFGNYYIDEQLEDPTYRNKEIRVFFEHLQSYLKRISPNWSQESEQIFERALQ